MSADTQAVLLLCGSLNQPRVAEPMPLTTAEYNRVAQALQSQSLRPADLLQPGTLDGLAGAAGIDRDRLSALLDRGAAVALAVELWTSKGLWVVSRGDAHYPAHLKQRLKASAPPLLYGVGETRLLAGGGLVIVGSREVDQAGIAFTEEIARRCAIEDTTVISGGARGVDAAAMETALDSGGTAVGVLADSLARAAVAKVNREGLRKGRLALCSPYDPAAGFSVGNAMGRNRQIYALGDAALVVSASANTGGTWAGATENLKHGWLPLFVRVGDEAPAGNRLLVDQGAYPIGGEALPQGSRLVDWMIARRDAEAPARLGAARGRNPAPAADGSAEQLSLPSLVTADGGAE
jgi:predicted Rossmann fold nucleotide-binding protein DprA/Smf involved in DNA uptake